MISRQTKVDRKRRKGSVMTEFALLAPLLMLMMAGAADFARVLYHAIQCCPGKVTPTDGKSLPLNVLWPVLPGNDLKSRGRKWPPERSIPTRHNGG